MSRYQGPATIRMNHGAVYTGTATLRTSQEGLRASWRGSFVPADNTQVTPGAGSIDLGDGRIADVLVQDWRFTGGGGGTAVVLGQGEAPF